MKKIIFLSFALLLSQFLFAKKVKFAVDMRNEIVNVTGVHISGNFQAVAGFPGGDWTSNETVMTQETADTNIYSVVVDIPAFQRYDYRFLNGDQFYDMEFVPIESRVGYDFNDNRWLWVDSLANDTTFVGAIRFGQNAPLGLKLVRFKVNMLGLTVPAQGAHVAGDFQNWNAAKTMLYSFGNDMYEIIAYVDSGIYNFKYYNGNSNATVENVPSACANGDGNRLAYVVRDTVLDPVCFSSCNICYITAIENPKKGQNLSVFPNPASDYFEIEIPQYQGNNKISVFNMLGKEVFSMTNVQESSLKIERNHLPSGIYFIEFWDKTKNSTSRTTLVWK